MPEWQEFVSRHKVPLLVGGVVVVGYLALRGRGSPAMVTAPPVDAGPMPMGAPPAAASEFDATAMQAMAIQNDMAQEALRQSKIGFDLSLSDARQQELFQGRQNQLLLEQQQADNEFRKKMQHKETQLAHQQLRLLRRQEGPGGLAGSIITVGKVATSLAGAYSAYAGLPGVPLPSGQYTPARSNQQSPPIYSGPYGSGYPIGPYSPTYQT